VASLSQNDVKITITVEIAETRIGSGFRLVFESNGAVKAGNPLA
jgi:hypothetical protein